MAIEIEKRFLLNVSIEGVLNRWGAHLSKTLRNHDIYYDTKDCVLTRNDVWLRSRNNRWELKYPNKMTQFYQSRYTSMYYETHDLSEIAKVIGHVLDLVVIVS
eukprot:355533_1